MTKRKAKDASAVPKTDEEIMSVSGERLDAATQIAWQRSDLEYHPHEKAGKKYLCFYFGQKHIAVSDDEIDAYLSENGVSP